MLVKVKSKNLSNLTFQSYKKKKIVQSIYNCKLLFFFSFANSLEFFLLHKLLNYLMFCGKKDKAYKH